MPTLPYIAKELSEKDITPFHKALLTYCEEVLRPARKAMQQHYTDWDRRNEVYMRKHPVSKEDVEAVKQGLPNRITVPLTYSQINTFVAYGFMLMTQRPRFYELTAVSEDDWNPRECYEQILQRDQEASDYKARLTQNFRNVGTFGLGCEVDWWDIDQVYLPVETVEPGTEYNGVKTSDDKIVTSIQPFIRREGTCIRTISPYRVFTDPGFHISEWKRGSFVAWDDTWSKNALKSLEQAGQVFGVDHVKAYDRALWAETFRTDSRIAGMNGKNYSDDKLPVRCITQLVINLVPNDVGTDDLKLGKEKVAHKWLIWIANDQRVIRCEPYNADHADFPVSLSFFAPDQHESVFNSLAYMVDDLQKLVSWLMNSRMAAVTRTIDNQFVVDPLGINVADIISRQRLIRMTKQGAGKDVRRYLQQLQVTDTTQGHVADMSNLTTMLQLVSGVNENAMGQYNGGRRSATEARVVTQGAAARMKMVFDVMWSQHYQPQANRCLINARQAMSEQEFAAICGQDKLAYYAQFKGDQATRVRSYDYVAFDGTQPSEKQFIAQQLMEVFSLLMSDPTGQTAMRYNMDPAKVLKEIMVQRGQGTGSQFAFDEQGMQRQMQMMQMQMAMQQAQAPAEQGGPPA